MKNIIPIIAVLIIGHGIYYFANEYTIKNPVVDTVPRMPSSQSPQSQNGTTQNGASQGKININEVCEGALIRMTFTNGAAAEKFVAECKEGKHPEVIEQFKAELNLGAGVEI